MTNEPAAVLRADLDPYFEALAAPSNAVRLMATDWGLVTLGAVSLLVLAGGVAILLSIGLASAAIPGTIDLGRDAALGLGLLPSMFGAGTTVSIGHGSNFVGAQIACTAFPWMLYPALATIVYMRFVSARLVHDRRRLIAFPLKLAAATAAATAGLAAVLPTPPRAGKALDGLAVRTNPAAAAVGAACVVLVVGGFYVGRRLLFLRLRARRRAAVSAISAAGAFGVGAALLLVLVGTMIGVPAGVAAADSTNERVQFVSASGVAGFNLGTYVGVVALGERLRVEGASGSASGRSLDLWHFSAPPNGERNPEPARFLLVLAPLLAIGSAAFRLARRNRDEGAWIAVAALTAFAFAFAISFGLIGLLARLNVAVVAPLPNRSGRLLVDVDVWSTIGHALFAAGVVGVGAGFLNTRFVRPSRRQRTQGAAQ